MKALLIYDSTGKEYIRYTGENIEEPNGTIQSMLIDIPDGKALKNIDVSVTPNIPIFEDIPKTEIELLKEQVDSLTQANAELTSIVATIETPHA